MFIYAVASAAAYIVNFYLAIRWLGRRHSLHWLRRIAGGIYVGCCALSWSWHLLVDSTLLGTIRQIPLGVFGITLLDYKR